jgi:hypothetical protein
MCKKTEDFNYGSPIMLIGYGDIFCRSKLLECDAKGACI